MFIIAKTLQGKEYCYNNSTSVLCKSEQQARELAKFMNENNNDSCGAFKLKSGEIWHVYDIDKYDTPPSYKLAQTKNKITVRPL